MANCVESIRTRSCPGRDGSVLNVPCSKSLVPEHEAVAIPPERLDPVPPLVDEQEQTTVGRVNTIFRDLHHRACCEADRHAPVA